MVVSVNENTFREEVLQAPMPVLVSFWAPWCGLCRLIEPVLTKLQGEVNGYVKLVSINADENFKLANAYRLQTLPTLLLINQGDVLHRLDTVKGHDDLRRSADEFRQLVVGLQAEAIPVQSTVRRSF
jgi:thioredoxin 1